MALVILFACAILPAHAYPDRPIKLVVPLPAGTGADLQARVIGAKMAEILGQEFVVENKVGGDGKLAVMEVARAKPDGYTVGFLLDGQMATSPAACLALRREPMYRPTRDLQSIGFATSSLFVLIVKNDLPVRTLADLVAYARREPMKVSFASAHPTSKLGIAQLKRRGISVFEVPYRGEPQAHFGLRDGSANAMFSTYFTAKTSIDDKTARPIAVLSDTRIGLLSDVPSVVEAGFPELAQFPTWSGLFAPHALPEPRAKPLNAALDKALRSPEVASRLLSVGFPIRLGSPEELNRVMENQLHEMSEFIRANDIQLSCD
jgi:tripartite-type tricarboxylate transporter receptor subunit TctC